MESSESDDEEEDEEEDLLGNILVDFLGGFVFSMKEAFFGLLSSSLELELELELELSGSSSPPLPLSEPPLAATALLCSFNQALASSKLSKIAIRFLPCRHKRSRSMTETATLQALSSRS
jgi:hypothetical protein